MDTKKIIKTLLPVAAIPVANALIFHISELRGKKEFEKKIFDDMNSKNKDCEKKEIKEHVYEWRHADVRYIETGSGEPLLLIHSLEPGSSLYEWLDVIHRLSENYRVYALDLPGFGHSDKDLMVYTIYFYVTLINDFLRNIVKRKAFVAASGLSAPTALLAAEMDPRYIRKAMLVTPSGISEKDMPTNSCVWLKWFLYVPMIGTTVHNILTSKFMLKRSLAKRLVVDEARLRTITDRYYYPAHKGGDGSKSATISFLTRYLNVEIRHKLYNPAVKTHIIWCLGCKTGLKEMFEVLKDSKNLSVSVFKNAYSSPHMECPDKFVSVCSKFFR